MTRPIRSLLALASLSAVFVALPADAAFGRARNAAVSFLATGPAGLKIEGKTNSLGVSEQATKVRFVVPLASLDTGIGLRNKHMREKYLEVGKYPNAELVVDRPSIKVSPDGREVGGTIRGTMTIHGQTRPVAVTYKAKHAGAVHDFEGTVHLNIKEFGIQIPSYMGVTVKPDVDVTVRAKVDDV